MRFDAAIGPASVKQMFQKNAVESKPLCDDQLSKL